MDRPIVSKSETISKCVSCYSLLILHYNCSACPLIEMHLTVVYKYKYSIVFRVTDPSRGKKIHLVVIEWMCVSFASFCLRIS